MDRGKRKLGLGLLGYPAIRPAVTLARAAEQRGFDAVLVAETEFRRDAVSMVAAILAATSRIQVGSAAVNVFTRGAPLLAITWAGLAELAPGRAILGIGVGSASTLAQQGISVTHPIGRLREYTESIRALWAGENNYAGKYVQLVDAHPGIRPQPPPAIYHCVGGPQALRQAARISDGIVLDGMLSLSAVARMVGLIHEAAGGSFRGEIAADLVVSIDEDWETAAARVRPMVARYLLHFPELVREMDVSPALVERVASVAADRDLSAAGGIIDDEIVDQLVVCGSAVHCASRIAQYRDAGITMPVLFAEPGSLTAVVQQLASALSARKANP